MSYGDRSLAICWPSIRNSLLCLCGQVMSMWRLLQHSGSRLAVLLISFWARWSAVTLEVFSRAPVGAQTVFGSHPPPLSYEIYVQTVKDVFSWRWRKVDVVQPCDRYHHFWRSRAIRDLPETPLAQCINSQHVSFINYPALWPIKHYR